jgi:hypothetical protein
MRFENKNANLEAGVFIELLDSAGLKQEERTSPSFKGDEYA